MKTFFFLIPPIEKGGAGGVAPCGGGRGGGMYAASIGQEHDLSFLTFAAALRFDQRKWELAEWRYVFRSAYIANCAEHREACAAM